MNVGAGWFLTVIRSPILKNKTLEGNKFSQILGVTSILMKRTNHLKNISIKMIFFRG
jgi:hypothetical protein